MKRTIKAFVAVCLTMMVIDPIWLGIVAQDHVSGKVAARRGVAKQPLRLFAALLVAHHDGRAVAKISQIKVAIPPKGIVYCRAIVVLRW